MVIEAQQHRLVGVGHLVDAAVDQGPDLHQLIRSGHRVAQRQIVAASDRERSGIDIELRIEEVIFVVGPRVEAAIVAVILHMERLGDHRGGDGNRGRRDRARGDALADNPTAVGELIDVVVLKPAAVVGLRVEDHQVTLIEAAVAGAPHLDGDLLSLVVDRECIGMDSARADGHACCAEVAVGQAIQTALLGVDAQHAVAGQRRGLIEVSNRRDSRSQSVQRALHLYRQPQVGVVAYLAGDGVVLEGEDAHR